MVKEQTEDRQDCPAETYEAIESESSGSKPSGKSLIFDGLVIICAALIVVVLLQNAGIM